MNQKNTMTWTHKIIFVLKMAIGSGISWQIADWTGSKYPYLAPISVILCLQATVLKSIRFGIARIVGTILGVAVTLLIAAHLPHNGWSIAFVLLISSGISLVFGANITSLHQIALSALLVLVFEHKLHGYGLDRIIDSIIGVLVALVIHAFIVPPNFTSTASDSIQKVTRQLVSKLQSLAVWIENGSQTQNYFEADMNQNVWKQIQDAFQQINKAQNSLRYHPFSKKSKKELTNNTQKLSILRKEFALIESFYVIIQQWIEIQPLNEIEIQYWSNQFRQLAKALEDFHPISDPDHLLTEDKNLPYHNFLIFEVNQFLNNLRST